MKQNKLLKYLKKYSLSWIYILTMMYSVLCLSSIAGFLLITPNINYLVLKGIEPIGIVFAAFGVLTVSVYVSKTIAESFGLTELIKSLEEFK